MWPSRVVPRSPWSLISIVLHNVHYSCKDGSSLDLAQLLETKREPGFTTAWNLTPLTVNLISITGNFLGSCVWVCGEVHPMFLAFTCILAVSCLDSRRKSVAPDLLCIRQVARRELLWQLSGWEQLRR